MDWIVPANVLVSPALYVLVTLLAFLLTGVSKGGFGGVGALSIPLMMIVAPHDLALGMWLPLLILCDIFTIRSYPKEWTLRPILLLAPWMVLGLVLGWWILRQLGQEHADMAGAVVKVAVGCLSVLFVGLEVLRRVIVARNRQRREDLPWRPTWLSASTFGLAGGVSTMLAHSAGAITSIYLLFQRLDKRSFVGTQGRFYFVFNTLKVPFFALPMFDLHFINGETLKLSLWLVPLGPLSVWLGSALNRRVSQTLFNDIIYTLLGLSGVYLIYANWAW